MNCSKCNKPMELIDQVEEWYDTWHPIYGHTTVETGNFFLTYACHECDVTEDIISKYEVFE